MTFCAPSQQQPQSQPPLGLAQPQSQPPQSQPPLGLAQPQSQPPQSQPQSQPSQPPQQLGLSDHHDENLMDISDISAQSNLNNSIDNIMHIMDNDMNQHQEVEEEALHDALLRIGLKSGECLMILAEEFTDLKDVLDLTEKDLQTIGFSKMGVRRRILRDLETEANRINHGNEYKSNESKSELQQLLHALQQSKATGNDAAKQQEETQQNTTKPEESEWIKIGKRTCFVGVLKPQWIKVYNTKALCVIMGGTDTDASAVREKLFRITRRGEDNKVRTFYDQKERNWPYSNMETTKDVLRFLEGLGFIQIFRESESSASFGGNNSYSASFGRTPVSTVIGLQDDLEGCKTVKTWMESHKDHIDWEDFAKKTHDQMAIQFKFCDFDADVDWIAFDRIRQTHDARDWRVAKDPMDS
eukprot:10914_1